MHEGSSQCRTQKRIFTCAFHHAPPARVTGNIDHGRKGPMHATGGGFYGCRACGSLCQVRVPGRGLRQWHWKHRPKTVQYVIGE